MKPYFNILVFTLSLAVFITLGFLLFFGTKFLIDQYEHLDPQWSSGIMIISAVFLICTLIIGRAIHSISNNKDKIIHPEKSVVYQNFIELWSQNDPLVLGDEKFRKDLKINSKQMMLWASDGVLKAHSKLQNLSVDNPNQEKISSQFEKVILAMRKDVGHQNIGILSGDISGILNQNNTN